MYEGPVQNLIDEFGKLPGVGPKSAQRLAFHLLQAEPESVERLRSALKAVVDGVTYCEVCGTVAAAERCRICSDPRRDPTLVCVVEEPKDIEAIERTREFRGLYHVLGGALDPINGVGPNELRIAGLMRRVGEEFEGEEIAEIIIATDPNTTGEATSTYLARLLRPFPELVVSRLASGLPMGADLEFADELTLGSALSGRRILSGGPSQPGRSGGVLRPQQIDTPPTPDNAVLSDPLQSTPPPGSPAERSPEIRYPESGSATPMGVANPEGEQRISGGVRGGAEGQADPSEAEEPRGVAVPHRP